MILSVSYSKKHMIMSVRFNTNSTIFLGHCFDCTSKYFLEGSKWIFGAKVEGTYLRLKSFKSTMNNSNNPQPVL